MIWKLTLYNVTIKQPLDNKQAESSLHRIPVAKNELKYSKIANDESCAIYLADV